MSVCQVRVNLYPGGVHPPQYDHKGAAKHRRASTWEPENLKRTTQPLSPSPQGFVYSCPVPVRREKGFFQHLEKKIRFVLEKKQESIFKKQAKNESSKNVYTCL